MKDSSIRLIKEFFDDTKALRVAKDRVKLYQMMKDKAMTTKKRTYEALIENAIEEAENLQLAVNRDRHNLSRLVMREDDQFYVFYLHYVKKKSLTETAIATNYTRDGVTHILQRIKRKCTLLNK